MESFITPLQKNVPNHQHRATPDQLPLAIVTWIQKTHHRHRQQALDHLTPIEFDTTHTTAHAA